MDLDLEDIGRIKERTLAMQQAKVDTWLALQREGLPVPPDLDNEIKSCDQFDSIMERLADPTETSFAYLDEALTTNPMLEVPVADLRMALASVNPLNHEDVVHQHESREALLQIYFQWVEEHIRKDVDG